jgi:hypothetical protein
MTHRHRIDRQRANRQSSRTVVRGIAAVERGTRPLSTAPLPELFPHLRQSRFHELMRHVEPLFDQSLDQPPCSRDEAAPLGTENQSQSAGCQQPERFSAAPRLTIVEDQLYTAA